MYIMYYRKPSLAKTYWEKDDPENAPLNAWIARFCEQENIKPQALPIWLHTLQYFLDTPHPNIIEHGREAGGEHLHQQLKSPHRIFKEIDPGLKHYQAVEYALEADRSFMAIWAAAPGEEFILSDNSFGVFEGKDSFGGPIHSFYIISPEIAFVLCSVGLKPGFNDNPELIELCRSSTLWDATHNTPKVTHAEPPPKFESSKGKSEFMAQENHWVNDLMEFEISTLSVKHTHDVNAIILGNAKGNGNITFRSEEAMLRTLDSFGENDSFNNHSKYAPLVRMLLEKTGGSHSFTTSRFDSEEELRSKFTHFKAAGEENSEEQDVSPTFSPLSVKIMKLAQLRCFSQPAFCLQKSRFLSQLGRMTRDDPMAIGKIIYDLSPGLSSVPNRLPLSPPLYPTIQPSPVVSTSSNTGNYSLWEGASYSATINEFLGTVSSIILMLLRILRTSIPTGYVLILLSFVTFFFKKWGTD